MTGEFPSDQGKTVTVSVLEEWDVGAGVPDLLVGRAGQNFLLEVKNGRGKLNKRQQKWHGVWRGQVAVVRNAGEALRAVGFNPTM